ncbi:thiosulfate oxidation carrier protein SoxY [Roseococcus suduntuyensis]|uniref:Sulfur-oxidizing protein SoxY n=1 Tax=Roseococcus suduntuyensis TaxID=455361 RepID=A0A840AB72_9PROT|nr:thiosulfate oxidation carrier protein SoxY [Roseococcus suduntuyensis]MBB3897395.1 sulfur-oxidizing protein SoxY [Roseococcus suduntuyensis]
MSNPRLRRRALLTLLALPWPAAAAGLQEAIRDAVGEGAFTEAGITLALPATAENGGQVPLTVQVESPQTEALHVTAIHIFATRNPTPGVASFRLTPLLARAEVQTRIRLAEHQQVIAIAVMSDGTRRRAVAEARVSTGGCLA